ncbi:MAG: hypothetical protein JXB62_16495 [Pirellulales bacterium]|nr:hypothetical protein [Pirellulales bacterium]
MNPMTREPQLDLLPEEGAAVDDDVRMQVWALLTTLYPKGDLSERRKENRYPFPYLVHLSPVAEDGITPQGEMLVVVGKHLSERGLGFYHPKPIPYRRMIVSLEANNGQWLGFLIDLNWCRFTKQGWYESGGRFLQPVLSPVQSVEQARRPGR